jgi:hypothetical protein
MQGFWWPGRQLVVVLPLALLLVLRWLADLRPLWTRLAAAGLALAGVAYYGAVLAAGYRGGTTWVAAPDRTDLHPPMPWLLPDDRVLSAVDYLKLTVWTVVALAVLAAGAGGLARAVSAGRGRSTDRPAVPPPAVSRT